MNAISLLERDHRTVEAIFDQLEELRGEGSSRRKKELSEKLVKELSVHAVIEEMIFYPEVKRAMADMREMIFESLEEHNVVKWELDAIQSMKVDDERFDAKIKVLRDVVMHHVEEEENDLFPRVRDEMDSAKLNDIGKRLEQAKRIAPTRPHPRAPDQPPGNVIMGMGAAVVDRTMDAGRAMMRGRGSNGQRTSKSMARTSKKKRAPAQATRAKSPRARAHAH